MDPVGDISLRVPGEDAIEVGTCKRLNSGSERFVCVGEIAREIDDPAERMVYLGCRLADHAACSVQPLASGEACGVPVQFHSISISLMRITPRG